MFSRYKMRAFRERAGLTTAEMGEKIGTTQRMVCNYELGATIPDANRLKLIADALEVSPNDLFATDYRNTG